MDRVTTTNVRIRVRLWWSIAVLCAMSAPAFAEEVEAEEPGRPCDETFMNSCPSGQVCVEARCTPKKKRAIAEDLDAGDSPSSRERGFRLGLQNAFFFGFAGRLENPRPAYNIALDFGFPTGRSARWHVEIGYLDLNGYTGVKFNPFLLGYTIPVLKQPIQLEVEVIGAILQSEILFGNGYAIALSAGMRAQLVAVYGIGWVAFSPLGFEIRYAYGTEDIGIDTGAGANWPMMLIVGVEL